MSKFRQVQSSFAYGMLSEEAASRTELDFVKQACSELTNFVVEPIGGIRKRIGHHLISTITPATPFYSIKIYPVKGSDFYLLVGFRTGETTFLLLNSDFTINQTIAANLPGQLLSIIQVGDIFIFTRETSLPHVIYPDNGVYKVISYQRFLIRNATDNSSLALQYKFLPFNEWNINGNETIKAAATSGDTTISFYRGADLYPYFAIPNFDDLIAANYLVTSTWSKALWQSLMTRTSLFSILGTVSAGNTLTYVSGDYIDTYGTMLVTCRNSTFAALTSGTKYFLKPTGTPNVFNVATSFENLVLGVFVAIPANSSVAFSVDKISTLPVKTLIAPANTNGTSSWAISEWTYNNGFPLKVSFVGTRLCFAGNKNDSEAVWLSSALNIFQFNNLRFKMDETATTSDVGIFGARGETDAHKTRATSAQFNRTSWIINADQLTVGCQGGIFILNRSSTGDFLPQKTTSSAISYDSAADIEPTMMEFGIVFVDQTRNNLKFIDFRSEKKGVNDISLLVTELFQNIRKIIYQRSTKTLWILDDNGLKSFTLSTFTNVAGFAQHNLDFFSLVSDIFLDQNDKLCLGLINLYDTYRVAVSRFEPSPDDNKNYYVDFFYHATDLVNTTAWVVPDNRFYILALETLQCTVDGVASTCTVSADGLTLTSAIAGKVLVVGKNYTARMKTVSLDPGGVLGSAVGALTRPDEVVLKVKNTQNMQVGGKTLYTSKATASLYSGDVVEKVAADPSMSSKITVESTGNYPCHILSITYKGFTQE